jgi:CelD/BcsL family acetyltransferase involved in cellulose biosynthesis
MLVERTLVDDSLTIELVDRLDPLRDDWIRLAAASGNVFATWEWNELWWRRYGDGRKLRVGVARRDGVTEAIVPLYEWAQRPLRIVRLIGHGPGERLGPICPADDVETAARALELALEAAPHDVFVGDWVAGDRGWAARLGGRAVRNTGYPILRFGAGSWDEFLASCTTQHFRKRARYARNRLERRHEVRSRFADSETLERDLDATYRLHRARFHEKGGCPFCGDHEAFQREFAAIALERGWLRLLLLEVDGQVVSCDYGFLFEDVHFAYQGGRDAAWDRESVGFVLDVESIRRALDGGAAEYRFLGGEEAYKYRLSTEDPRLETIAAGATRRGRLAAGLLAAAWRFPPGEALLRRVGSA